MQVQLLSGAPHDELNIDVLVHNESDIKVRFKYTRSRVVGINGMVIKQCIKYYRDSSERRAFHIILKGEFMDDIELSNTIKRDLNYIKKDMIAKQKNGKYCKYSRK